MLKKSLFILAVAILAVSCRREPIPVPEPNTQYTFFECIEDCYGDFYGNGTDNYVVTLASCREDSRIYMAFDLNCPVNPSGLGVAGGKYVPLRGGSNPAYTYIEGAVNGAGEITGSFLEEKTGGSSFFRVFEGSVNFTYNGKVVTVSGTVSVEGELVDLYYEGVPAVNDYREPEPDPDPKPDPEKVDMNVTYVSAANYGDWYDCGYDDWYVELWDDDSALGEYIQLDILTSKIGEKKLPAGTYPVSVEYAANTTLGAWLEYEDEQAGTVSDWGGAWYMYYDAKNESRELVYGATKGTVTIVERDGIYSITVNCEDEEWGGSFKAVYSGVVDTVDESATAVTKASSKNTRAKGGVCVSKKGARGIELKLEKYPHRIHL